MNTGLIPVRYAKALLDFAHETKSVDKVYGEAKLITLMFMKMGELRLVLEIPVIDQAEKRQLILNAAGGTKSKKLENFTDLIF